MLRRFVLEAEGPAVSRRRVGDSPFGVLVRRLCMEFKGRL